MSLQTPCCDLISSGVLQVRDRILMMIRPG
jgi:hypothetical protein